MAEKPAQREGINWRALAIVVAAAGIILGVITLVTPPPPPPLPLPAPDDTGVVDAQVTAGNIDAGENVEVRVDAPTIITTVDVASLVDTLAEESRLRGEVEADLQQVTAALEALNALGESEQEPARIAAAFARIADGDTTEAEAIFREVVAAWKAEGQDAYGEAAAAARHLGALALLHDTDAALAAYQEAVDLDPENPDGWNQLGHLRDRIGDLPGAEEAYTRAQRLGEATGDDGAVAVALGNLGLIEQSRGNLDTAEEYHRQALALHEALGHKVGMVADYANLGNIERTRGNLETAREYHFKALALNRELGRKEGMAVAYGILGNIEGARGNLERAEDYYRIALTINEELGRTGGMAIQYANMGNIEELRGNPGGACAHWARALELYEQVGAQDKIAAMRGLMEDAGCDEPAEPPIP